MTALQIAFVLLLCTDFVYGNFSEFCKVDIVDRKEGEIKHVFREFKENNCSWTIHPLPDTITTLRVLELDLQSCTNENKCCLFLTDNDALSVDVCNEKLKRPTIFTSRKNNISIRLETGGNPIQIWLSFSSRSKTECSTYDNQCLDKTGCYNSSDLCTQDFICKDHSDFLGCGVCNSTTTLCNNLSNQCFDLTKRCDGVLDCGSGEDELGCSHLCPNLIKCPLEDLCFALFQICDDVKDCWDGFDEKNCSPTRFWTSHTYTLMFFVCSFGSILLVCIIFRCIISKRNVARFLRTAPDFPLEPFEGPGDPTSDSRHEDILEPEFRQGGEVFEHYMMALRNKKKTSLSVQTESNLASKYQEHPDNELLVLASLNVSPDLCVGLELSESSKESLKTLTSLSNPPSTPLTCRDYSETCLSKPNKVSDLPTTSMSAPSTHIRHLRKRWVGSSSVSEPRLCEGRTFTTSAIVENRGQPSDHQTFLKKNHELIEVIVEEGSDQWSDTEKDSRCKKSSPRSKSSSKSRSPRRHNKIRKTTVGKKPKRSYR